MWLCWVLTLTAMKLAEAFERVDKLDNLRTFHRFGAEFYGLPLNQSSLVRKTAAICT